MVLSIARQFGSAAETADGDAPSADATMSAAFQVPGRTIFMLNILSLFALAGPRRMLARPGRKSIPLGPTHPALLTSDPHENEGRIVPASLRTHEDCRNSVGVPDDCRVRHPGLRWLELAPAARLEVLTQGDGTDLVATKRPSPQSAGPGRPAPTKVVRATHEYRNCRNPTSDRLLSGLRREREALSHR